MKVVALVPAHNEEDGIAAGVTSLLEQERPPDRILVVADNCTDSTVQIVSRMGVEVMETAGNTAKKAGALNQAFGRLLRHQEIDEDDYLFVMDADSHVDSGFISTALNRFSKDENLGGVGGTFIGGPGGGLCGMFQRNEYVRYARDVRQRKGRVLVLTGTATLFRVSALFDVIDARNDLSSYVPFGGGRLYDEHVLTEDNELTLALLHLGYEIVSPKECGLTTEVMQTWGDLARQRLRWKRGAIENLLDYGLTHVTFRYWVRQALSALGVFVTFVYLVTIAWALTLGTFAIKPFWLYVTAVFVIERVVTVRKRGIVQMLIAAPVVIEMVFDIFLQAVQAQAFIQAIRKTERSW